jgi:hypothetical protein
MSIEPQIPVISTASRAIVFIAYMTMAAGGLAAFTLSVLVPALSTGVPPPTWSWGSIWLFEVGLLAILVWLGSGIYQRFTTDLTSSGVSVQKLRTRVLIPWSQVVRVKVEGHEIHLFGKSTSAVVNVFCFTKPDQVGRFISSHLPPDVLNQGWAEL